MPIVHHADLEKRRIVAKATGTIGQRELFAYQRELGQRPEWAGFDELFDVSGVDGLADVQTDDLKALAGFAASMDRPDQPSKFALVAPQDLYFGLGRLYEALRETAPQANRQVAAFRACAEAERWLDAPVGEPVEADFT
ncbi:MAG: hypothetical protein EOL90_01480 [Spartobacteria bacterium]|nr:hypothetical protein [Spartobacteria bacterium]